MSIFYDYLYPIKMFRLQITINKFNTELNNIRKRTREMSDSAPIQALLLYYWSRFYVCESSLIIIILLCIILYNFSTGPAS